MRRLVWVALTTLALMAGGAAPALASPSSPHPVAASSACNITEVDISGTMRCLDGGFCATSDLILYWNRPISANPQYYLCIRGSGFINLNTNFLGRNWNDQASAFWTGCRDVNFYVDINLNGGSGWAAGSYHGLSSPSGTFPYGAFGNNPGVGNDQLSSLYTGYDRGCEPGY
jgi:hypothetical protein